MGTSSFVDYLYIAFSFLLAKSLVITALFYRKKRFNMMQPTTRSIENAVVLLSYPEKAFGNPKALRAFISTNVALSTLEILSCYVCRWPIEVFFRQCKTRLALDTYQIRSSKGIQRYWLLMSMAHYICVIGTGRYQSFQEGHQLIRSTIQQEKYQYLFQCAKSSIDFEAFMKLAG